LCGLAIELGCSFVGRSFAGDPKQLVALIKAAGSHRGTAVLDVISPCVTFNNHEGSTKSYKYAKEMETPLHELGYIPFFEQITVEYEPGTVQEVEMHDGSRITLKKTGRDYDPTNSVAAMNLIKEAHAQKQFLTGLLYIDENKPNFTSQLHLGEEPLATLPESKTRPGKDALKEIMESLM
ncbi:MAG: 2-oxoacid:ferredoxin oxidoreductase subunit beta, partial [Cyanobacteriota bacterium erpe_2018_sw_39hr_WHONDRS-SW48-000098_B_bin.30]|nr:2-oxoacid:ferredoxin oxidoreductase subunit beta [Cyanobacteriota bacterium erpe_2018_sw_39hr_WHONDRS-SW48-000098_B_bin.30]